MDGSRLASTGNATRCMSEHFNHEIVICVLAGRRKNWNAKPNEESDGKKYRRQRKKKCEEKYLSCGWHRMIRLTSATAVAGLEASRRRKKRRNNKRTAKCVSVSLGAHAVQYVACECDKTEKRKNGKPNTEANRKCVCDFLNTKTESYCVLKCSSMNEQDGGNGTPLHTWHKSLICYSTIFNAARVWYCD